MKSCTFKIEQKWIFAVPNFFVKFSWFSINHLYSIKNLLVIHGKGMYIWLIFFKATLVSKKGLKLNKNIIMQFRTDHTFTKFEFISDTSKYVIRNFVHIKFISFKIMPLNFWCKKRFRSIEFISYICSQLLNTHFESIKGFQDFRKKTQHLIFCRNFFLLFCKKFISWVRLCFSKSR